MDGMDSPLEPHAKLRSLRKTWDISQNHLAELSGVAQPVISRLEHGADATWETWRRLFGALGYEIVVQAEEYGEDDLEDLIHYGIQKRKERMEAGRARRW